MITADLARVLDIALALGLPCFPCLADKRPATPHGYQDATPDPTELRALWRRYPAPLIGVATGAKSGIDALDIDGPRHPKAAAWFAARHEQLPTTRTHRTRSGGLHLLFRHSDGQRCWTGRPMPGIDRRADGGYLIWWPAAGLPVECDAPLALWPHWLLADLRPLHLSARTRIRATIPDERALADLVRRVAGAAEGERNSVAFWAACRAGEMAASGLLAAETAAAVIAHAAMLSGLARAEAERTAWSGVRTGSGSAVDA